MSEETTQYPPDYTGHEEDPKQEVTVWETAGTNYNGYEFTWWKSQDAALDHINSDIAKRAGEALYDQLKDGDDEATFSVTVKRVTTTAADAYDVFEN
mgnify:CR=1 FL=1